MSFPWEKKAEKLLCLYFVKLTQMENLIFSFPVNTDGAESHFLRKLVFLCVSYLWNCFLLVLSI